MRKLFIVFMVCLMASPAFAEIIRFKYGKVVDGKIIEQGSDFIKVDQGIGVNITYYMDEIESINGQDAKKGGIESLNKDTTVPIKPAESTIAADSLSGKETSAKVQAGDEQSYTLRLKDGTVKISLPNGWIRYKPEEESGKPSASFIRKKSSGVIEGTFIIDIVNLGYNPFYNTKKFQMDYLNKVKKGLTGKTISFEDSELFSVPALFINHETKDKTKNIRELHFVKDCKWYQITFIFEKENFDGLWQDIYKDIEGIEFIQ